MAGRMEATAGTHYRSGQLGLEAMQNMAYDIFFPASIVMGKDHVSKGKNNSFLYDDENKRCSRGHDNAEHPGPQPEHLSSGGSTERQYQVAFLSRLSKVDQRSSSALKHISIIGCRANSRLTTDSCQTSPHLINRFLANLGEKATTVCL